MLKNIIKKIVLKTYDLINLSAGWSVSSFSWRKQGRFVSSLERALWSGTLSQAWASFFYKKRKLWLQDCLKRLRSHADNPFDSSEFEEMLEESLVLSDLKAINGELATWKRLGPSSSAKRIGVIIDGGQAMRTFLYSSFIEKLKARFDVIIFTPQASMKSILVREGIVGEDKVYVFPNMKRLGINIVMRYAFFRFASGDTYTVFKKNLEQSRERLAPTRGRERLWSYWDISAKFGSKQKYEKLYSFYMKVFASVYPVSTVRKKLRDLNLDAILNTNTITHGSKLITRSAKLAGIPVLSNVISWDNLSNKWFLDEFSEAYFLWSPEMEGHFMDNFSEFSSASKCIAGSPQFEQYTAARFRRSKADFFKTYGLDNLKKLLLYTTGSKTTFPAEPDYLEIFFRHWRTRFKDRAELMIRLHPKDRTERYLSLIKQNPDVVFTFAGREFNESDGWLPTSEDIVLLSSQINHADLIVNVASTMTLEGFACEKPSINIGFDMGKTASLHYPLPDYYLSAHYRSIVESGAAKLAASPEEVSEHIENFLSGNIVPPLSEMTYQLNKKCAVREKSASIIVEEIMQHIGAGG